MPPVGLEIATPTGERPQNYALDRAATGTGTTSVRVLKYKFVWLHFVCLQ